MNIETRKSYFRSSVEAILSNWTALRMLVSHQTAGNKSQSVAEWLINATINWMHENKDLEAYEVANFLEDIIVQEFNAEIQDGSFMEVANNICRLFNVCGQSANEEIIIAEINKLPKTNAQITVNQSDSSSEDDDDEDMDNMDCDMAIGSRSTSNKPQPDEDGWITIPNRKKK